MLIGRIIKCGDDMKRQEYIDRIFEEFRLVKVLSDHNGGQTWQLRHNRLDRDVVLHSFDRPLEIYRWLQGIRTDLLPEVYEVYTAEDGMVVLEEFVSGMTVAEILETGLFNRRGATRILRRLCKALQLLHENGFVHRDVKAENVMVDREGRVVLIDFNAFRRYTAVAEKDTVQLGTVGYSAPEQFGLSASDARTDIYAAGVLLNIMLTGQHPTTKLAKGHLGRVISRCTHISPEKRFSTVTALAKAL